MGNAQSNSNVFPKKWKRGMKPSEYWKGIKKRKLTQKQIYLSY